MAKNTASCAIISAIQAKNNGYDTIILLPSDHYITILITT
jgi:mannose-1-phosphate guanylyltransferase